MHISRRGLLIGTTALVACSSTSGGMSYAQAITTLQGVNKGLELDIPIIGTLFPKTVTAQQQATLMGYLTSGDAILTTLSGTSLQDPTSLSIALNDLNNVLSAIAPIAQDAADADPKIQVIALDIEAAIMLAPLVEQLVTNLVPATTAASPHRAAALAKAIAPSMSLDQAKARFHLS